MSSQEQMEIGKSCAYVATLFLGCFYTTLGQVQEFHFFFGSCFAKTIAPEQKTYQELDNLTNCNREVAEKWQALVLRVALLVPVSSFFPPWFYLVIWSLPTLAAS